MMVFFLLWCACALVLGVFKKTPSPQFLRAEEPLVFTGSPYVAASDEGVWRLLLNVYLRLKIGKLYELHRAGLKSELFCFHM